MPHCDRWGTQLPHKNWHNLQLPTFRLVSIVAKLSPISATAELLFSDYSGHLRWTQKRLSNIFGYRLSMFIGREPKNLSVVYNVRAPYSGGSNFRQYFYGIRYLGYPLISTENFTEIVPGEPLRRGVKHKRGSQV